MSECLLFVEEAAALVGVDRSTIWKWVQRGHLRPYATKGRRHLYLDRDVYEAERTTRTPESLDKRLARVSASWS